jgi:ADP-heptose:LPS heptosyltransferase
MKRPLATASDRVVVLFSNGIGDALLTLPTLRALTAHLPGQISLLCPAHLYRLCFSQLPVHRAVELQWLPEEEPAAWRHPGSFDARVAAAEIGGCDVFVALVPWLSRSLDELVKRLMPHTTVGLFPRYDLRPILPTGLHAADLTFTVARLADAALRMEDYAWPPELSERARATAREWVGELPAGVRLLVVHPDTAPDKRWAPGRHREALDAFLDAHPEFVAFVVGRSHEPLEGPRNGDRVVSCLGLPLDVTFALVGHADLFLGIDSCMLHAADLFRVPGVGLFGPDGAREWGFRFSRHRHVHATAEVADIPVEDVLLALESVLEEVTRGGPTDASRPVALRS